jgi:hypothetical protein
LYLCIKDLKNRNIRAKGEREGEGEDATVYGGEGGGGGGIEGDVWRGRDREE